MIFFPRRARFSQISARGVLCTLSLMLALVSAQAAPRNRVTTQVDASRVKQLTIGIPRQAQAQFDQGAVDPTMAMNYMLAMFRPSSDQQADLDQLLLDQQNPSSPNFRKWLSPQEYGNRFGLSVSDQSRVTAWLVSQGFKIDHTAGSGNWIAFSGTAAQVSRSLHTELHYFQVDGQKHFANVTPPSVPEALAGVISGFRGLHDFRLKSQAVKVDPNYNSRSGNHYLAPEDWATIYDVTPLVNGGFDGTGQNIAIVGQSDYSLSDVQAFRTQFGLPANNPKAIFYGGTDPGVVPDILVETDLDLEWAGAIAPKATINYVFGQDAFTAILFAVELNVAPIISISYGACELDDADPSFRSFFQQGNAQGITIVASAGDAGAASCDLFNSQNFATHGLSVSIPNVFPEVTSVGGTQFVEGSGTYWASSNDKVLGSALSYIPEAAWNETSQANGLTSTGGGLSQFYPRPAWQQAAGLSNNLNVRYVPDVAFSAALHDAYLVIYEGALTAVGGTSASAPSFAGLLALLNHYEINNKFQSVAGLGNINPQLYRLAQSTPSVFHDTTAGSNIVPCLQATPGCVAGSYGYSAAAGYDPATGLGSVDATNFVMKWNTATSGVIVKLSLSATKVTVNGMVTATATVLSTGTGTPTGSVDFNVGGGLYLGNVPLTSTGATGTASLTFPVYNLGGVGTTIVSATYSGDSAFSSGGATARLSISTPAGAAGIVVTAPTSVTPSPENPQGLSWQATFSLTDVAGVPSLITGFSIDGVAQPLAQYFPAPAIPASGTLNATLAFYNLPAPVTKKFDVTGVDTNGNTFLREFSIQFLPLGSFFDFLMTAAPLTPVQNVAGSASCQWPVQVILTDISGNGPSIITTLQSGGLDLSAQIPSIFGTTRLNPYASLQGTICFSGLTAPATVPVYVALDSGAFNEITVSFLPAPATPVTLTPTPALVSLAAADPTKAATATLNLNLSDKTQPWNISISPNNRTSSWLSVSPLSGTGPATITVTADPTHLGPGAYGADVFVESPNSPQALTVPVMFVLAGGASSIVGVANPASHTATASPGQLLEIYGSAIGGAAGAQTLTSGALPQTAGGVSVTVNGYPANLLYVSPQQLNIQIPYEVGAGPAVLGVNNNGLVAGLPLQIVPASPGIFADGSGNIVPAATVAPGGTATLFFTGAGDVYPQISSGFAPTAATPLSSLPVPLLPVSVTVGGTPAFVQFLGIPAGLVGVEQLNFIVPKSVPVGTQPVVVTVNGVASPAANVKVTATSN